MLLSESVFLYSVDSELVRFSLVRSTKSMLSLSVAFGVELLRGSTVGLGGDKLGIDSVLVDCTSIAELDGVTFLVVTTTCSGGTTLIRGFVFFTLKSCCISERSSDSI